MIFPNTIYSLFYLKKINKNRIVQIFITIILLYWPCESYTRIMYIIQLNYIYQHGKYFFVQEDRIYCKFPHLGYPV